MQRLFWKIFGWFWGAMVLIGLTLFFVVTTAQPNPLPDNWRDATSATLHSYALTSAGIWEKAGQQKLTNYLNEQSLQMDGHLWFYMGDRELTGREPGRPLRRGGDFRPNNLQPNGFPPAGFAPNDFSPNGAPLEGPPPNLGDEMPPRPERPPLPGQPPRPGQPRLPGRPPGVPSPQLFRDLRQRALQSGKTDFEMFGRRVLIAHRVSSPAGKTYVLQADIPAPRLGRPAAGPLRQIFGVLAMLLVSGLVCYVLVRYITAPLENLRLATENFARGDLTSRTGADNQKRRDEVADLGRDFDLMAERIEALVHSQRRLLGDISHELRSPLSRLSMGLALARRSVAAGAPKVEIDSSLERIKRETVRLNSLIEQLLQWTRLESGASQLPREKIQLDELLQDVVSDTDFEGQATQRKVVLLRSVPCAVQGSPDLLQSAIENILRNALRYTPPETRIEASLDLIQIEDFEPHPSMAKSRQDTALITIRDYGAGVPQADLSEIFKPFYRVAQARDRQTGGVGLGLAITERAVRSCGGSIRARNASGGGLQMEIRLPATSIV